MRNYFLLICVILLIESCSKDKAPDSDSIVTICDSTAVSYNRNIKQILDNNCALSGCHDALPNSSGIIFTSYSNSKYVGQALDNINDRNGQLVMPPSGKMPDSLITQIETWVANGYCE